MFGLHCMDCGVHTGDICEYYMLLNVVWRSAFQTPKDEPRVKGMLCVGCVESRLGRELNAFDFAAVPLNVFGHWHSDRLNSRLSNVDSANCVGG